MADYTFAPELLATQRAFLQASARVKEIGDSFPRLTAIAVGEADVPEELRQALQEARAEEQRLAVALQNDRYFATVDNALKARMELRKAAAAT
ncbi:hypothetical protein ACWEQG_01975 [Microbispora sp. NPDC004025]